MRISVIIPCHNGADFLAQTLVTVRNQTLPAAEVIVVDDGSTDGSAAIASDAGARVLCGRFGGASAARNAGVAMASGEALMFLDADDLLGPTVLADLAAVLAANPDAVAACPWERLELVGEAWVTSPASCAPRRPGQDALAAWLTGWYHPPCALLWSRTAYDRTGGWDPQVRVNTDGDIMMRGLIAGNRLVGTDRGVAYYRRLPGGAVSLSNTRQTRTGTESRLFVLDRIAHLLEERGRLELYRAPLAEAYATVAVGAEGTHPDLADRARAREEQMGGPAWRRRLRPRLSGAAVRLAAAGGRVADAVAPPRPVWPPRFASNPAPVAALVPAGGRRGPVVSVVIPTYNRAHLLPRAVDSVLSQDFTDLELLVVDDGSTDDTATVLARYDDPRLRHIVQPRNAGVAAARNRGMAEARGEFIALLDSDDEWLPGKLTAQVALMRRLPERVGLVYGGVEEIGADGAATVSLPTARGYIHGEMLVRNLLHGAPSNGLLRRAAVQIAGGFDGSFPAIEDYEYWLRVTRLFEVDFVPQPISRYWNVAAAAGPTDGVRRSMHFTANMEARRMLHERYRHEMRRAGVEHLYLLDTARRHLESELGDPAAVRRHALRALVRRPGCLKAAKWLLPRRAVLGLWAVRRGLRGVIPGGTLRTRQVEN